MALKRVLLKFYSGFSLKNEQDFFSLYLDKGDYCIAGFSYGSISALKETLESLDKKIRVDRLQLFSPAFFQTYSEKFKRLQLMSYSKDRNLYLKNFIELCFEPYAVEKIEHKETDIEELQELLVYEWSLESLKKIENSGVKIEVYLGGEDKIIDVTSAYEFFLKTATVTYIKDANHFLQL